jgi:hypothetical protein
MCLRSAVYPALGTSRKLRRVRNVTRNTEVGIRCCESASDVLSVSSRVASGLRVKIAVQWLQLHCAEGGRRTGIILVLILQPIFTLNSVLCILLLWLYSPCGPWTIFQFPRH